MYSVRNIVSFRGSADFYPDDGDSWILVYPNDRGSRNMSTSIHPTRYQCWQQ